MSNTISNKFVVQIRIYPSKYNEKGDEIAGLVEPQECSIYQTENKEEAYSFFESLKSKSNDINKCIRYSQLPKEFLAVYNYPVILPRIKPFFEARILKQSNKTITLVDWTWISQRHIDISYYCKIQINRTTAWSKRVYHVPPVLFDPKSFPADIKSREATAFAYDILRSFLPRDSFKLKKIATLEKIDVLKD